MFIMKYHNEILIKHNNEEFFANTTVLTNIEKLHNFANLIHKIKFQFSQINNFKRAEHIVKHITRLINKS